ncbi:TIGR03086 family metal-binding protein [Catenuloplanes japonicus]|uniref:TIGR03086 family metal-binding protein n=1 Tax=Catenuloplanes japonicus TaxID=33876 RepID=UPI000524B493|nr:TIGR03086 family metal-binding protein [Catenuloplanes japonicus]
MTAIFAVLDDLARVTSSITPDQEGLPTPCTEMDVHTLRGHLLGWLHYFDAALTDPAGTDRPDPDTHPSHDTALTQINTLAATVRSALSADIATVNLPRLGGAYPVTTTLDFLQAEALGHGWDLSVATGQPWHPSPAISADTLTFLRQTVQPAYRGPGLPFGPEIPIPADAPTLDRLLAFTGRDPSWKPAA